MVVPRDITCQSRSFTVLFSIVVLLPTLEQPVLSSVIMAADFGLIVRRPRRMLRITRLPAIICDLGRLIELLVACTVLVTCSFFGHLNALVE